jgi:hypothetical protein
LFVVSNFDHPLRDVDTLSAKQPGTNGGSS